MCALGFSFKRSLSLLRSKARVCVPERERESERDRQAAGGGSSERAKEKKQPTAMLQLGSTSHERIERRKLAHPAVEPSCRGARSRRREAPQPPLFFFSESENGKMARGRGE